MTFESLKTTLSRVRHSLTRPKTGGAPGHTDDRPSPRSLSALAQTEGWDIFDCGVRTDGSAHIEIQRLDSPEANQPRFDTDHDAWSHVVARAQSGSALHVRALTMVDPTERAIIRYWCEQPHS